MSPPLAAPSTVPAQAHLGKEGDMRRITALILVLVAMATAAAFPLAASADHGGVHGGGPISLRAT